MSTMRGIIRARLNKAVCYTVISACTALLTAVVVLDITAPTPSSLPTSARASASAPAPETEQIIKINNIDDVSAGTGVVESSLVAEENDITQEEILRLVNTLRYDRGVAPLALDNKITAGADAKCQDMSVNFYYDHKNPNTGKHGYTYVEEYFGAYANVAENLNRGDYTTADAVVDSWVRSPGHFRTMINPKYTHTGIAVCEVKQSLDGKVRPTVVQHFVKPI